MRKLKKLWCLVIILSLFAAVSACASGNTGTSGATPEASTAASPMPSTASTETPVPTPKPTPEPTPAPVYKDGTYEITTGKDIENYYVKASLTIKDGKIADFHYDIYDSRNNNALFDESYEKYMNTEVYKQQCRDDLAGMKTYGPKLIDTQSVDEVDVVSKATWTWKWFKKVAQELLDQATEK